MGSPSASNSQNPWAPYETSKDCSLGVCGVYCPQWCYMIFVSPPPPPPRFDYGASSYESSGINFSPLIIALIGIFGSAFIMITYYTIISKYCGRRGGASSASRDVIDVDANANSASGSRQGTNAGMEEALIKSIKVHKYKKNDGLVEGTDCSVCLSEFVENESLRLLPKCSHAFHVPCIDAWLKSNASCPLCRSSISAPIIALVPQHHNQQQQVVVPSVEETSHREMNVSALEYHHTSNVSVLVVEEREQEGFCLRNDEIQRLKRSVSLIEVLNLHNEEEDEEEDKEDLENQMENFQVSSDQREKFFKQSCQFSMETGTSKGDVSGERNCRVNNIRSGVFSLVKGPLELKRSISTGRFGFTRYAKENNCIIPH